jgi:hypothetical protein
MSSRAMGGIAVDCLRPPGVVDQHAGGGRRPEPYGSE